MTNDAPLVPRRVLLRTAAVLGAAVTTRLLTAGPAAAPGGPAPSAGPPSVANRWYSAPHRQAAAPGRSTGPITTSGPSGRTGTSATGCP
ncbi:hypothetical protein ACFWC2_29860, partial [Streptomyces diastaticus]